MIKQLILCMLIAALSVGAASAIEGTTIHFTNYGGGLSPSNFFSGSNTLSASNPYYNVNYYNDASRAVIGGSTGSFQFYGQGQRAVTTTYNAYSNHNQNYRSYSYGSWQPTTVAFRDSSRNYGVNLQTNYRGGYSGSAYTGGYYGVSTSNSFSGASSYGYPYNRYSMYGGQSLSSYQRSSYVPSAYVSGGNYWY